MKKILAVMGIAALAAMSAPAPAAAQDYPNKPIRLISPYTPGGGNDIAARIMADALSPRIGQQVVVENRPGAGGIIGSDYVAKSAPDGYTWLWASVDTLTMIPALKASMPYEVEDLTFIAKTSENGMTFAITSKLPVKTLAEFIAYCKVNPGKVRYGTNGVGAAPHLATELFLKNSGIKMTHIAYKGIANAMNDLLGAHIEFVPLTPVAIAPHVDSDKLRIIGFTASERHPMVPNVPTLKEAGFPQATVTVWYSMVGPGKIPAAIAERMRKEVAAALADPATKEKLAKAGSTVAPVYGDAFKKMVADEIKQWKEIAKAENIVYQE